MSEVTNNCFNCLFSNIQADGSCKCDKVKLIRGKYIDIPEEKVHNECPAHSDKPIEESRAYYSNHDIRDADDSCNICGRRFDPRKRDYYREIDAKSFGGNNVKAIQCAICQEKGRVEKRYGM